MARTLTIYNNFIAPSGYILLKDPIIIKKKPYVKIWSPFWDIIINRGLEDIPEEEKKKKENWTWYGIDNNEVKFHVLGDKVINYFQTDRKPRQKDIYLVDGGKKSDAKIQKKTSSY